MNHTEAQKPENYAVCPLMAESEHSFSKKFD